MSRASARPVIRTFADYREIVPVNPLRDAVRVRVDDPTDDPIARAERALADLSGQFVDWMLAECDRLTQMHHAAIVADYDAKSCTDLFRAAHDIKGVAPTFGFTAAADVAASLCNLIEETPAGRMPALLVDHHVGAIQAIVRDNPIAAHPIATELVGQLRMATNMHLALAAECAPTIVAPSLVPED